MTIIITQEDEVKHLLTQRNLSIKEIAAMVGVSEWTVVKIKGEKDRSRRSSAW